MLHDHPLEWALVIMALIGFVTTYLMARESSGDVEYVQRKYGNKTRLKLVNGVRTSAIFHTVIHALVLMMTLLTIFLPPPPPSYDFTRQTVWRDIGLLVIVALLTGHALWSKRFRKHLGLGRPKYQDLKDISTAYDQMLQKRGKLDGR